MQWPGYTSFFVGAVLPIFVSIPCLFHYFCCWSESCLGCLLYISCLFLAFYSLFSCSMQSQLNWIVISMYIGIANMLYIFQIKSIKTKKQKKTKNNQMILLIVFIHQLLCIENTKEQLPDMHFCHPLQENISSFRGGCRPPHPLLTGSFFLATPVNACLYMIYLKCLR